MNREELKEMGIGVDIEKHKCPYCKDKLIIVIEYDLCCEEIRTDFMEIQHKISKGMQEHINEKHPNKEVPWQYKLYYKRPLWIDIPISKRTFSRL